MNTTTEWQGINLDGSGKYKLVFSKENKLRICSVRCCRNLKVEEVYYFQDKLVKARRKICNKCRSRLYRANNPIKHAYRSLRASAKRRSLPFTISFIEFEQLVNKTEYITNKGTTKGALHIDRIDPTKGYCAGNLQVLTCSENIAKGNRERFLGKIKEAHNEDPF